MTNNTERSVPEVGELERECSDAYCGYPYDFCCGAIQRNEARRLERPAYIAEPARRIIEKIAHRVTTMGREGNRDFHEGCEAVAKDCLPFFERLGLVDDGDGLGFDEDQFPVRAARHRTEAEARATRSGKVDCAELADPNVVHVNMLRGGIAKPSIAQIIHIYGEEALIAALSATRSPGDVEQALRSANNLSHPGSYEEIGALYALKRIHEITRAALSTSEDHSNAG
jgi:hypothetical protein